jgi:hypothetical protein
VFEVEAGPGCGSPKKVAGEQDARAKQNHGDGQLADDERIPEGPAARDLVLLALEGSANSSARGFDRRD